MFKKLSHIFILTVLWICSSCQKSAPVKTDWPEIDHVMKPWSRWWWHGSSVSKEGITAELEAYARAGIGGLELTPIYGVIGEEDDFIPYLSEEWVEVLEYTLQEAERLGLGIDMATGTGWPFGGPWVKDEDGSRYLAHKLFNVSGGQQFNEWLWLGQKPILRRVGNPVVNDRFGLSPRLEISEIKDPVYTNENMQVLAIDQIRYDKVLRPLKVIAFSENGKIDLTQEVDDEGMLYWEVPDGNWKIIAIYEGLHGKMVERAAPGAEGRVIDHFSKAAIRNYLTKFDEAFENKSISSLRAFFNDSYEVDDARGQANWTPEMLQAFQDKHNYDLLDHLPALFGEDAAEKNIRVLSDYRETISDLILETFTTEWDQWAVGKDAITRNQAHGSPANILDLYAASDIPEAEGTDIIRAKFASSAAHVAGKSLASAEAATWLDEHFQSNLADLKQNIDRYFVAGINHVVYHGTCYSPPEEQWPGRLFYAAIHANPRNPLWKDWSALNAYIARTQSFLQTGHIDNDILLYYPMYDRFATPDNELLDHFDGHGPRLDSTEVKHIADRLLEVGYSFDFISDRQIRQLGMKDGEISSGFSRYKTVLIPECKFMPVETFAKLIDLAQQGAHIMFHKGLPQSVPGLGNLTERKGQFNSLKDRLNLENADVEKGIGLGKVYLNKGLEKMLESGGVYRETMADHGLHYTTLERDRSKVYFVSNWSGKNVEGWIPLQTQANSVIIYNAMTGRKGMAKVKAGAQNTEVYLQIPHGSSVILQCIEGNTDEKEWQYWDESGQALTLNDGWQLDFLKGGPELPETIENAELKSWTEYTEEEYRNFSGTAKYTTTFVRPDEGTKAWLLDLGKVYESAEVTLNGESIATLIGPEYKVVIEAEKLKESNLLEIEVSNLMANRIIYLENSETEWKRFYNINFPPRLRENRGEDGLFAAAEWEPFPSGLLGPVKLVGLSEK